MTAYVTLLLTSAVNRKPSAWDHFKIAFWIVTVAGLIYGWSSAFGLFAGLMGWL